MGTDTTPPTAAATPPPTATQQKPNSKEMIVASFPADLGTSSNPVPYMLIKIFETKTGTISEDQLAKNDPAKSLRTGSERAWGGLTTLTGGSDTLTGAAVAVATGFNPIAGAAVGLFSGTIASATNTTLNNVFDTNNRDYVGEAKLQIQNFALKRNQDMLSSMFALFMPEGMSASYDQDFEGISVTQALGTLGFLAQAAGSRAPGQQASKTDASNPFVAEGVAGIGSKLIGSDVSKLMTFATTGTVVNPQIELLYTSPVLRKFTFDFRLVPRSRKETEILFGKGAPITNLIDLGLINLLKYYSAPTIVENSGGRYYIPPAQFELEFWYNDPNNSVTVNKNLFRTKRCVLESVNLDYGPSGFAMHYDGAPVEVRMQLTFQETVMLDREAIKGGY